jgi:DNA-directed DNA polymerase III PolC
MHAMPFTHLEVHSHFTLLGATPSVADLVARARADGLTHLALTDTNALYGAAAFARACRAADIQPIIGMTITVAAPAGDVTATTAGKLVLLATDATGYRSLCRLSSAIQGQPQREALAARGLAGDALATHRAGLICLSGGQEGWIERYLRAGQVATAQRYAGQMASLYGQDFYLALELHSPGDEGVADAVVALGQRLGLATVAVQPIFCLAPADAPRLRLLEAIRANARLRGDTGDDEMSDPADPDDDAPDDETPYVTQPRTRDAEAAPAPRAPARSFSQSPSAQSPPRHWLSPALVASRFARFPQALAQSGEIAAACRDCLPDGKPIWPGLALPHGQTPDATLTALAQAGLERIFPVSSPRRGQAQVRLHAELDAIRSHGFAPLFLVVADIVRFGRQQEIPVSTRGSVANSLVAFCTGITTVDPIEHGLLFERFLNPARTNPPDIDLDFCSRRRNEVLRYVRDAYGADRVALIGTVSTMQPQSAVRETAKAYGMSLSQTNRLVSLLPHRWHPDPRRRDQRTVDDVLAALTDPLEQEAVRIAYSLVGQPDHLSVHPGGVVITPGPLTDVAPVQWAPKGFLITQFEHRDVEALGLQKMDLLGIRALTVLADAAAWVREGHDPGFRLADIPLDDAATADLIARGETIGVFQCESDGAQRTLRKLKARGVRDLAIANAFFKPGPAMGGMAGAFVRRYRGEQAVTYLHPALEPILGPTQGVLIFQEQILRLAREIAGLTWAQADQLRRGMSHFGAQEMAALAEQFIAGCQRPPPAGPGFSPSQAATLWEQVMPFAGYGFNQGHATAYADVSFRSAYLKAHYPAQFLCARLADYGGFHHPAIYMAEAVRLGLTVRPPHINFSAEAFSLVEGRSGPVLFMGLGQVRDLRRAAITAIRQERAAAAFSGLRDLLQRVDLRPKEIEHLIRAGALDGLAPSRAALLAEAQEYRHGSASQMAFDFGRPVVPAETLRQRWDWETELLGLPVSALTDPLALVRARLPAHTPLTALPAFPGQPRLTAGVRLPGWTGGPGFFLGDGATFVIARGDKALKAPPPWQPLLVQGRWIEDGYGTSWLQVEEVGRRNEE